MEWSRREKLMGSVVLIPRYVRVNTHRMTMDESIEAFKKEGYTFMQDAPEDLGSLEYVQEREKDHHPIHLADKWNRLKTFCRDHHLDDLLVFAPKTDLHNHPLYVSGHIILQVSQCLWRIHTCMC